MNINQLDTLNFIISLFQASTCFEHMCSSSGGQYSSTALRDKHVSVIPALADEVNK